MINSVNRKRIELLIKRNTKHGQAGTRTYVIWKSMIGRCERPTDSSYKHYGAKGVTVSERWHDFQNFFEDMGEAPEGAHLHRRNDAMIYSSATCQWLNKKEHIGLHNTERGWGARKTKKELLELLADERVSRKQADRGGHKIRILTEPSHLEGLAVCDRCNGGEVELETPCAERIHQQLLSTLAAIEKHNKTVANKVGFDCYQIGTDLSTLHEHNTETLRLADATAKALRVQLFGALAAIEHVRKREGCIVTDERFAQIIDNVELSALRKHDEKLTAEVRKPLVDLLKECRPLLAYFPHYHDLLTRLDALVKEGK
jgi:hypothetical protein